jgi:hypothetical protein
MAPVWSPRSPSIYPSPNRCFFHSFLLATNSQVSDLLPRLSLANIIQISALQQALRYRSMRSAAYAFTGQWALLL